MDVQKTLLDAYNCERELLLNLMEIEEGGVRINLESLLIAIEIQKLSFQRPFSSRPGLLHDALK